MFADDANKKVKVVKKGKKKLTSINISFHLKKRLIGLRIEEINDDPFGLASLNI